MQINSVSFFQTQNECYENASYCLWHNHNILLLNLYHMQHIIVDNMIIQVHMRLALDQKLSFSNLSLGGT